MRRWLPFLLALLALAPTGAYEALQKSAEVWRIGGILPALSHRAEIETPWRPRTGHVWFDQTVHEFQEARTFYALAGNRLARKFRG